MNDTLLRPASGPSNQADGLRRLFAGSRMRFIALVSNPHVASASVLLERLSTTLTLQGRRTLLVDAAENSPLPHEMALLDLGSCIETLSDEVSYLAARGLPLRHVDTRGSAAPFLDAVAVAAPQAEVVLLHASAAELARIFSRRSTRPVLLAADQPESVTHAYAAMKLLQQRCALMTFDLLLAASPTSPRAGAIARSVSNCAENFLGALLHDWVVVDPGSDARDAPPAALQRLVATQLRLDDDPVDPLPHAVPARAGRQPQAVAN